MLGYDMAQRKISRSIMTSHSEEIQTRLRAAAGGMETMQLYIVWILMGDCSIKDNGDRYAWNDFYNVAGDYVYIRKGIISMMERNNSFILWRRIYEYDFKGCCGHGRYCQQTFKFIIS